MGTIPFFTKPSTWCLFLHQSEWDNFDDDAAYCNKCEAAFHYPTKRLEYPVYKHT